MGQGRTLGALCLSTVNNENGPLIDGASTHVEKWGEGRHCAVALRPPGCRRALVVTVRGSSGRRLRHALTRRHRRRMAARRAAHPATGTDTMAVR